MPELVLWMSVDPEAGRLRAADPEDVVRAWTEASACHVTGPGISVALPEVVEMTGTDPLGKARSESAPATVETTETVPDDRCVTGAGTRTALPDTAERDGTVPDAWYMIGTAGATNDAVQVIASTCTVVLAEGLPPAAEMLISTSMSFGEVIRFPGKEMETSWPVVLVMLQPVVTVWRTVPP